MSRSESGRELVGDEVTEGSCLDFILSSWNHLVLSVCGGRGWLDLHFMSMWGRREKEVPAAIERKGCGPGQAREDVDGRERYSMRRARD